MNPHFYKARSILGMPNIPYRGEELNLGVEEGPEAILSPDFLSRFPKARVDSFNFPNPRGLSEEAILKSLETSLVGFKNLINSTLEKGERQIVLGGDNSVTFSSLLADLERIKDPKKIGYLQFDSHGEIISYQKSSTKNFHGMYIHPFFDYFDIPEIEKLVPVKIPSHNFLSIGNLDLEEDEKETFQRLNLKNINRTEFLKNPEKVLKEISLFIDSFEYLHINFDIDVFDYSLAQATGVPSPFGGFMEEEIFKMLSLISAHPNFSFDLCEVNPKKPGADSTVVLAISVLERVLI